MIYIVIAAFLLFGLFGYSLCVSAGKEDRLREELEERRERDNGNS